MGATANPPKSDDIYVQLTRGAFISNDFIQNPHFRQQIIFSKIDCSSMISLLVWIIKENIDKLLPTELGRSFRLLSPLRVMHI